MSSGERMQLAHAAAVASDFLEFIQDVTVFRLVAGSIRRKKASVGDIEIVVQPSTKMALNNRLDVMVNMGTIAKAEYGKPGAYRWGESYRGIVFMGARIEIFSCDADNRGFQMWLRTGSGEKNQYAATRMKQAKYPVRFDDGYAWHVGYDRKDPMFDYELGYSKLNKLRVAGEADLYSLLGMPMMPETKREEIFYRPYLEKAMNVPVSVEFIKGFYAVGQMRMF